MWVLEEDIYSFAVGYPVLVTKVSGKWVYYIRFREGRRGEPREEESGFCSIYSVRYVAPSEEAGIKAWNEHFEHSQKARVAIAEVERKYRDELREILTANGLSPATK